MDLDTVQLIALTMGIAWASGINLYAAIETLGILGLGIRAGQKQE